MVTDNRMRFMLSVGGIRDLLLQPGAGRREVIASPLLCNDRCYSHISHCP